MPFPYEFELEFGVLPSIQVVINDEIPDLVKSSPVIEQRIEERSIARFTTVDLAGTETYQRGQGVEMYDTADELIFGGVIDNPETVIVAPSGELYHPISCVDYHYFADKRLVAESYQNKTCGFIVEDIFDKYLAEEGVTIDNIELGATLVEAIFNYVRVTDAYDALAEKSGKIWYIDENKALYFQNRDTAPAPWTLDGVVNRPAKGSARLSGANPRYRNRQYIRGGRATTTPQTETFAGDIKTVAFTVGYPIVEEPVVTVNAVVQTIGIKGIDEAKQCYWSKGDPTVTLATFPGAVDVVVVYKGEYDILALVQDEDEIASQLAIEGAGTGYVEDIADEPTLNEKEAVLDSGRAKLARFGIAGQRFIYQTIRSGLKPGQLQPVSYAPFSLTGDMLIEAVTTRANAGNLTYDITAIQGPESGSWADLFKALFRMKQEVVERLNVGSSQILIILVQRSENWKWTESDTETVWACPICDPLTICDPTTIVC